MGILQLFTRSEKSEVSTTADDALLQSILTGKKVTVQTAMGIPAVSRSVSRIADMVAILPIKLYRREAGKVVEVTDDIRTHLLNIDSGDTLTPYNIKRNIARDYLIDKGGFLYIVKKQGQWHGLRYVPPEKLNAVINDTDPLTKDGRYLVNAMQFERFEFVSVLRDSDDGFFGKSLTRQLDDVLETALFNLLHEKGMVKKGGLQKGFLQSDKLLDKQAMEQLKTAWRSLYATTDTAENVVILNQGLKFQPASDNAVDLQMNQRKQTLSAEIEGLFGIEPEQDFEAFFRAAVLPVLEAFESSLNASLLLEIEKGTHFFQIDKREVLKASLKERYDAYEAASRIGVLTKNEIRQAENLEAIDGLDVVSMGLGDVIYDVNSQEYFTPNTGNTKVFGDETNGEVEQ